MLAILLLLLPLLTPPERVDVVEVNHYSPPWGVQTIWWRKGMVVSKRPHIGDHWPGATGHATWFEDGSMWHVETRATIETWGADSAARNARRHPNYQRPGLRK